MFDIEYAEVAPPAAEPAVWDAPDFAAWIDELAAADPGRALSTAELLAAAEGGSAREALTVDLAGLSAQSLTADEQLSVVVAAQRCLNHYAGVQLAAVAAFAGPAPDLSDPIVATGQGAFAWAEVSAVLRVGEGAARTLIALARRLAGELAETLAAMTAGEVSLRKAQILADATACLTGEQARAVQARVLPAAAGRSPALHAAAVRRAVIAVDPDGWERRRDAKLRDVALIRQHHGDGVADVLAQNLTSIDAETIWQAADTWARTRKADGDPATLEALRVAALVHWAKAYLTGRPFTDDTPTDGETAAGERAAGERAAGERVTRPARPTRNGVPAVVNVLIPLPAAVGAEHGVATIAGCGEPLPAQAVAELLAAGARIRFALTDQHGHLVGISTRLHDPTALMRAWIALRDVTVRTPSGSTTPVAGQDLDHIHPHNRGGPTDPTNLHAPTRGWHRAATFGHWTITGNANHTLTWTSNRTGRTYTTHPYNHRDGP